MKEYPIPLANAILASMTEGVIITDTFGTIVDINPAAKRLHGFKAADAALGHYAEFDALLDFSYPSGETVEMESWPVARLIRGETFTGYELAVRNKATGQTWRNVYSGTAVSDATGSVVRLILTLHDISKERDMRRQILEKDIALIAEQEHAAKEMEKARANQWLLLSDVLRNVTEGKLRLCRAFDELPPQQPNCGGDQTLTRSAGISGLRHEAQNAAAERGFNTARCQDLITAVGEAAMNAIVHGGGGKAVVCGNDHRLQVWIEDKGEGITVDVLPNATLGKGYTTAGTLGQGMKLMLQTIDRLYLMTGASGTTVVLEQDKTPEPPAWLLTV